MPDPTMHPNGFLQYPLVEDGSVRLHIWSGLMPPGQLTSTPIHDHTFDFESYVLLGTLEQRSYEVTRQFYGDGDADEPTSHWLWGAAEILRPVSAGVDLEEDECLMLGVGSHYTFPAGKFHQSRGHGLTATVMRKTALSATPWAYVAVPWGVLPDNEFRRDQYHPDLLMDFVRQAKFDLFGDPHADDARILRLVACS